MYVSEFIDITHNRKIEIKNTERMQWEKNVVKRTDTLINRYKNREAKINRFNAEDMLISLLII